EDVRSVFAPLIRQWRTARRGYGECDWSADDGLTLRCARDARLHSNRERRDQTAGRAVDVRHDHTVIALIARLCAADRIARAGCSENWNCILAPLISERRLARGRHREGDWIALMDGLALRLCSNRRRKYHTEI